MGLLDELAHPDAIAEGVVPMDPNAEDGGVPQDVNSPVWESHMTRDWKGERSDPQTASNVDELEPVRTIGGQLDYMLAVSDENDELGWMAENSTDNLAHRRPQRKKVHTPIDTYVMAATDFRTVQFLIGNVPVSSIVKERDDRTRVVLVNRSANPIAWSHNPIQAFAATNYPPNTNTILQNERIEIKSKNEIYALCAATLTATIEILEEYILDGRRD